MTTTNDGGAAFPTGDGVTPYQPGMTLRDYFAAAALTGFCSNPNAGRNPTETAHWLRDHGAVSAYQMADAMLRERSKP